MTWLDDALETVNAAGHSGDEYRIACDRLGASDDPRATDALIACLESANGPMGWAGMSLTILPDPDRLARLVSLQSRIGDERSNRQVILGRTIPQLRALVDGGCRCSTYRPHGPPPWTQ